MYSVGEYVVKANKGVCKIEDIMHLDMHGIDKNQLYYYMVPLEKYVYSKAGAKCSGQEKYCGR